MVNLYKPFLVVCEGLSEENYIRALMQARECLGIRTNIIPKNVGSGQCGRVVRKFNEVRRQNKNNSEKIRIWVDDDLYVRNCTDGDKQCAKAFEGISVDVKSKFRFSSHNFEDFLALHLDDETLWGWIDICRSRNHFSVPMHSEEYMPLVQKHLFPNYGKGDLPFELNEAAFRNLFRHNADPEIPFRSTFADFLKNEVFPPLGWDS
ncbi:MAG: RloB domain-containing protein [Opitutales bacterium]|nr:RloB domain-containing protein [Opitutales bacterium]